MLSQRSQVPGGRSGVGQGRAGRGGSPWSGAAHSLPQLALTTVSSLSDSSGHVQAGSTGATTDHARLVSERARAPAHTAGHLDVFDRLLGPEPVTQRRPHMYVGG